MYFYDMNKNVQYPPFLPTAEKLHTLLLLYYINLKDNTMAHAMDGVGLLLQFYRIVLLVVQATAAAAPV